MSLDPAVVQRTVEAQHARQPFSGVVQVRQHGAPVFASGYGWANRAEEIPNTVSTRFGTASGTKTFTAIAICRLIDDGRLSADTRLLDVIEARLPQLDPAITIGQLLTHTSGAPDYFDEDELDSQTEFASVFVDPPIHAVRRPGDILPLLADRPMLAAPGARFAYNNGGFVLLGLAIEGLSGRPYAAFVEQEVFARAGMTGAGFFAQDRLPPRTALGYLEDGRSNIFEVTAMGMPDGGAYVAAADMGAFWDALLGRRLLSPESTERVLTPQVAVGPGRGDGSHYGYGLWLDVVDHAVRRYTCSGADPGVAFWSSHQPAAGVDVTVLGNTNADAWPMARVLAPLADAADTGLTL